LADDLDALAADIATSARKLGAALSSVMKAESEQVRDDWRAAIRPRMGRRLRHVPASITYNVRVGNGWVEGEIGPDKNKRQGALAHIVEFGTSRHGPIAPAREAVVDAEEPRFVKAVHDATEGLL
jgi:hypothetical protein